ncbi:MAG TPA: glycoside hydrolase family 36 protein [Thermomicrobiales bacterium]|nr:glycoside hydrolase family 36 protein [Thermomicrobiales bacterium]
MSTAGISTASLGTAYARSGTHEWHIGNTRISMTLTADPGNPLRLVRITLDDHRQWHASGTESLFRLATIGDQPVASDVFRPGPSRVWTEAGAVRLAIELQGDESTVAAHFQCHEDQSVIRQWLEIVPTTPLAIGRVEPFRLAIHSPELTTVHTISGVQRQGGWRADQGAYRSFMLEHQALEAPVHRASGIRSTWDDTPWMVLTGDDAATGGILMALEYGGQWEFKATRDEGSPGTIAAFAPVGTVPDVSPGERWISPSVWIGAFPGDLDSAAAVMHHYLRDIVLPPTDDAFPWVQYNTWFSYYCDFDAETLLAEADVAAAMGVEVFYVDAGWWIGNPRRRDRFSSGLGNWTENREKFPDGLRAFADGIRSRGMHFGLWIEPERVDLRTATTGSWNPDWIARRNADQYVRADWPSDTETAWLCFGHEATQAWAEQWIGDLVQDIGIRWLKWDSNYWGVCTSPGHGHGTGDGEAAQLEGVYHVMERLRRRFPDLVIENCAGGATRMDFALARQTPVAWLNDASEPAHRSRFHNAGASYLFPPGMLNAWVTESEHENVNGQDLPDPVWRAVIRSRMLGAIGFSCQLVTWSEGIRAIAREEINRYKAELRPLLRSGLMYHLLPQPEIPSDRLPTPDVWEAYQFSSADDGDHVILGFRNVSPRGSMPVPVNGLQQDHWYVVTADGEAPSHHQGKDLMGTGVSLTSSLLASTWVTITRDGTRA